MQCSVLIFLILNYNIYAETIDKRYASKPDLFYQDNYDNCMLLGEEAIYCKISYILQPLKVENVSETWRYIKNISSIESNYNHKHLRHSICVPKTCPEIPKLDEDDPLLKKSLEHCYNRKYKHLHLKGTMSEITCKTTLPKYPVDWLDVLSGIFFLVYICFVLFATCYESMTGYNASKQYKNSTINYLGKMLTTFSLITNWNRLKTIKSTPQLEKLRGIQGIRFYNSAIVVLSHTLLGYVSLPLANTRFTETLHENAFSIFFASGHLCMTTFFFISSFLLSNDLFEYLKDKRRLNFRVALWIFAARLFRQIPSLAVVVLFHSTWIRHLGDGPHWDKYLITEYKSCRKNWWTNLLFINNYVGADEMCVQASWWLALNTQYVVLSLFLIWILKKHENYFWMIIGATLSFNVVITFWENYSYDFPSLLFYQPELYYDLSKFFADPQTKYQLRSFTGNSAGILIGIAFGYYYYKRNNGIYKDNIINTQVRKLFWWVTILGLGIGCVIVPGLVIYFYSNEHSAFWASLNIALSRPLFAFFLGVLIIGFTEGIGWITLNICSWSPLYVLGRLTYSVYLVQHVVIMMRPALSRYPIYISPVTVVWGFFGDLVVVYILASLLTLFVELPVSALQKLIFVLKEETKEKDE